ncbi:ABC transporter ATP-binding protein [Pseudonocardia phyllosphaerae]|uniref:ABC transporter ATP-binding protein n=1 Tax=Pseudonocardia phyllosphaerae TaxID=3390502 RepID=UPI00397D67AC
MSLVAECVTCVNGRRTVLTDVDLAVAEGEVLGLVGPNGSGKSTLLRALAGIRPVASGRVLLDGHPLAEFPARARARRIAFVGQEEDPPADLTVAETVALGRLPHRPPWAGGDADEHAAVAGALAAVDLTGYDDRPVEHLSGGERRRVLLARGLAQDAGLLLLDEPTNHLDVRHAMALLRLVAGTGRTVVVALHDLDLAVRHCDRLVVLDDGRARPAVTDLDPDTVRDVFGVSATRVRHPVTGETRLLLDPAPPEGTP